ncbi:hypothetical protein GCM10010430_67850 [Kitasatospora cystarginea]|uniref:Uncharacterized protein n=1 Tax=Kitasatospora cystarginea TaxID=58350 RepID=A0ABP5RRL7_9ACTN
MGTVLPTDYRLLCELYPAFALGDFLGVAGSEPGEEQVWTQATWDELEMVAEWSEEADPAVPLRPHPAQGGLLPWASSNPGRPLPVVHRRWRTGGVAGHRCLAQRLLVALRRRSRAVPCRVGERRCAGAVVAAPDPAGGEYVAVTTPV